LNGYRRYLLGVLLVVLAFNYVDRLALGLLLQDIKGTLQLSDTQLGFLGGIAFAVFYSVMGIPIARWSDRGNRVAIITITTALWSVAVAMCGAAMSFVQLLLIRIGVAVGEAGCVPPAHSLIAETFSRAERPKAVSIYMLGSPLSVVVGFLVAGWLDQFYGWRATFAFIGLPGLGLALLAWATLREPRQLRVTSDEGQLSCLSTGSANSAAVPSFRDVSRFLWRNATFRHLLLCMCVWYFFGYGVLQWQPAFFIRSYGLETGELGTWYAVIWGICGVAGTYLGGEVASRRAAHDERLQLVGTAIAFCLYGGVSALIYVSPNKYVAFALMGVAAIGFSSATGPLLATIQTLVPDRMRATSIALVYLFANLIGMGLGPLMAGALSDALTPLVGQESLRYSLLALCPGYFWGAWHLLKASRTVTNDLDLAHSLQSSSSAPGSASQVRAS